MATKDYKRLADRVWDEIWHRGNLDRLDDLFASDFVRRDPGRELHGVRTAFPDGRFTTEDQISEGNKIAVRYRFEGTTLARSRECRRRTSRLAILASSFIASQTTRSPYDGSKSICSGFSDRSAFCLSPNASDSRLNRR